MNITEILDASPLCNRIMIACNPGKADSSFDSDSPETDNPVRQPGRKKKKYECCQFFFHDDALKKNLDFFIQTRSFVQYREDIFSPLSVWIRSSGLLPHRKIACRSAPLLPPRKHHRNDETGQTEFRLLREKKSDRKYFFMHTDACYICR